MVYAREGRDGWTFFLNQFEFWSVRWWLRLVVMIGWLRFVVTYGVTGGGKNSAHLWLGLDLLPQTIPAIANYRKL
jgi:hypothetical protein